jgi:pyrroloquinoline quinone biosynthesis protein B
LFSHVHEDKRHTNSSTAKVGGGRGMKLRVHGASAKQARRMPSLLLSPGHGSDDSAWCRVDAGRGVMTDDDGAAVVLTGMQRDQVSGLLDLRDGAPIDLYATPAVFEHLTLTLPLLPVLQQFCGVQWHLIPVAGEQRAADFTVERLPTLVFTALTTTDAATGERIALAVRDERSRARLFVVHGASLDSAAFDSMLDWMKDADCVVIDRAPHADNSRWLDRLAGVPSPRKLLLDANGSDRSLFAARGIECARETMEFEL